jgi:hypothetical protein
MNGNCHTKEVFSDIFSILMKSMSSNETRIIIAKGAIVRSKVASPQKKSPLRKKLTAVPTSLTMSRTMRRTLKMKNFVTSITCDRTGFDLIFFHLFSAENIY